MGELWRSKEMSLIQLFVQFEAAHDTVQGLGKLGLLQFVDLNPHVMVHQRHFVPELKRLAPLSSTITAFTTQIGISNRMFMSQGLPSIVLSPVEEGKDLRIDEIEETIAELKTQMDQSLERQIQLDKGHYQILELKDILGKDEEGFFAEVGESVIDSSDDEEDAGEFEMESLGPIQEKRKGKGKDMEIIEDDTKLRFITGVIPQNKFLALERTLFRISKGQAFLKHRELENEIIDPETGKNLYKNSFIIFYRGKYLGEKITKLCIAYGSHIYPCPESAKERRGLRKQLNVRLDELELVRGKGREHLRQILEDIAKSLDTWHHFILKETAIYHTLNSFNFDQGRQTLIGECWCPTEALSQVQHTLNEAKKRSGSTLDSIMSVVETNQQPPTYFKTNKFTKVFQKIVDAYGIARYREVNPAVFTVITFPWQFGIMFGDVGHGFLLFLFALLMLYKEKEWEGTELNEMLAWPFKGRYLLLLMAFYSMWMGALYNECFAVTIDWGSNWHLQVGPQYDNNTFWPNSLNPDDYYAFGVDPVWKGSTNELLYYNSVKMKMSIIVGVLQMTVGLVLHCLNAIEFHKPLDIFFEFIPRLIFLECIFGYLCFMIFYKWGRNWLGQDLYNEAHNINGSLAIGPLAGTNEAPVLLNELIYMFLPSGTSNNLYQHQSVVQTVLVIFAFVSIPFMFLPKPLILRYQHKKKQSRPQLTTTVVLDEKEGSSSDQSLESDNEGKDTGSSTKKHVDLSDTVVSNEEPFEFGELMIHQLLETIEFVLGSISHTASYLRLWALSLAHSELATVFWEKIMFQMVDFTYSMNPIVVAFAMFAAFSVWFVVTLLVMMFMELLSALLHALRLHWVEFQSKFYKGDGYAFSPFSFRRVYKNNRLKIITPTRDGGVEE